MGKLNNIHIPYSVRDCFVFNRNTVKVVNFTGKQEEPYIVSFQGTRAKDIKLSEDEGDRLLKAMGVNDDDIRSIKEWRRKHDRGSDVQEA